MLTPCVNESPNGDHSSKNGRGSTAEIATGRHGGKKTPNQTPAPDRELPTGAGEPEDRCI